MQTVRWTWIWCSALGLALALACTSSPTLAQQIGATGSSPQESSIEGQQEPGEPQRSDGENFEGEPSGGIPVNERSFQEGTIMLPQARLFGDWFGRLPAWEAAGFTPRLSWVTNFAGNPVGGRAQGFTECEDLGLDLMFDLGKLQGIDETYFHVAMSQRSGTSLTNEYLGSAFSSQQLFGGETFKLVNVEVQRYFWDRTMDVKLGRIGAGDDFLITPYYWGFMSGAVNGPAAIYRDAPGMNSYPNDTWGARLRLVTSPRTYAMLGLYNGDPDIRNNESHGCDFSMHGPLFAIAEVGYQRNGHASDPGKLGNYKVGGYYNGGTYDTFSPSQFAAGAGGPPSQTVHGKWGYYALFDQVLFQPYGKKEPQALGVFGSVVVAPDDSVNEMPFFCNGGAIYRGLLPSRPTDSIWFGVAYGKFSPELEAAQQLAQALDPSLGPQEYELVYEWAYRFRLRDGAMFFQPDLQYIVNPGGAHQYANALQVGVQAGVNF